MKEGLGLKDSHFGALLTSRKKMFLGLVGSALACGGLTFYAPINGDRSFYSNVLALVASGSAFALSIEIVHRQKLKGVFPQMYASLALALGLWFTAEATWAYYELGLGIETPFPSVADAFWLAGYVPFSFFLIGIMKHFLGFSRSTILPVIFASALGFVGTGAYRPATLPNC